MTYGDYLPDQRIDPPDDEGPLAFECDNCRRVCDEDAGVWTEPEEAFTASLHLCPDCADEQG